MQSILPLNIHIMSLLELRVNLLLQIQSVNHRWEQLHLSLVAELLCHRGTVGSCDGASQTFSSCIASGLTLRGLSSKDFLFVLAIDVEENKLDLLVHLHVFSHITEINELGLTINISFLSFEL